MKRVCTYCGRKSIDENIWCEEPLCTAENMPQILEHGEYFGEFNITKSLQVTRSAVLYEAERGKDEQVILKVAHTSPSYEEKLKKEALFLDEISRSRVKDHVCFPQLVTAHRGGTATKRNYGKVDFQGKTKYYLVLKPFAGEPLKNFLLKQPQPPIHDIGYITLNICDVLGLMQEEFKRAHLSLTPESIFIRRDKEGIPRIKFVDFGAVSDIGDTINSRYISRYSSPAYLAPELLLSSRRGSGKLLIGKQSDVYSVGLILYEMLAGQSVIRQHLRHQTEIEADVAQKTRPQLQRADIHQDLPALVNKMISFTPDTRTKSVKEIYSSLYLKKRAENANEGQNIFDPAKSEGVPWYTRLYQFFFTDFDIYWYAVATLLTIAVVLTILFVGYEYYLLATAPPGS